MTFGRSEAALASAREGMMPAGAVASMVEMVSALLEGSCCYCSCGRAASARNVHARAAFCELNRLAQTPMKKARRMSRKLFNVGTANVVVLPSQVSMEQTL